MTTLHPAFLIAAAVNDAGWIELPAAVSGTAYPIARAEFAPAVDGRIVQRVAGGAGDRGAWHPIDMTYFARCLALALGPITPSLFAVRGVGAVASRRGRFERTDAASEEARLRVLRGAFHVHHAAYDGQPA